MSQFNQLCKQQQAALERALIIDFEHFKAICINCYDLVSKGLDHCQTSLQFILDKALYLSEKLSLPLVVWSMSDPQESSLEQRLIELNHNVIPAHQFLAHQR